MSGPFVARESAPAIPQEHLEQLDQIDQTYWWHRVRWRVVRHCLKRFRPQGVFSYYFDIGSGGGGLPGLLVRDFTFDQIQLFDQHEVKSSKIMHPNVVQRFVDLEAFKGEGLPPPDLITCLDVLEHLRNPSQLLRGLRSTSGDRRSLLVVTVPALSVPWSSWDELAGHHRRYTRRELCDLLEENGWNVSYCAYFFHAAVAPLLFRRKRPPRVSERLEFPQFPRWLNWLLEQCFWWEYRLTHWCRLPFGSSLIVVAQ